MKTEKRKVTIEQEVYIAFDGQEFYDESACAGHEVKLLNITLDCYDSRFRKTTFDHCVYANLITSDDVQTAIRICDYWGATTKGLIEPGLYMYNDYDNTWLNLDSLITHIRGGSHNDQD